MQERLCQMLALVHHSSKQNRCGLPQFFQV